MIDDNNNSNGNDFNLKNPFLEVENQNNNIETKPVDNENQIINNVESTPVNNGIVENNQIINNIEPNPNEQINNTVNNNSLIVEPQNNQNTNTDTDEQLDRLLGLNKNRDNNSNENAFNYSNNDVNAINMNDPRDESEKKLDEILGLNNVNNDNPPTITNNQEEKITKGNKLLRNDMIIISLLEIIIIVYSLISNEFTYIPVIGLILSIICLILAINNTKITGFFGLIIGISMILSIIFGDIIDCLLGIYITIHSLYCIITSLKKSKNN